MPPAMLWINPEIIRRHFGALPRHAHGGIVTKPTLGLFGEAGPEAYIPLDAHGGRFMERLGFGNRVEQTIIFELSGREIARRTLKEMPRLVRLQGVQI